MAFHWLSVFVDDKLGEIPLDRIEQSAALFLLEISPQRVGLVPVDVNLCEQIELGTFFLVSETFDLLIATGLLLELVRRESKNAEAWKQNEMSQLK